MGNDLQHRSNSNVQSTTIHKYVWQAFVRIGLFALERQKDGFDKTKHSLEDIKKVFLTSLSNWLARKVRFPDWHLDDTSDSQVTTSDSQQTVDSSSTLVDFNDHCCPVWRAKQIGLLWTLTSGNQNPQCHLALGQSLLLAKIASSVSNRQ